jgi:ribonucleoside-diphosphate reductase alpha chain
MLDNVIDLNFYPTEKAERSNLKHRPVGLGLMGWTDYIVGKGIDWESNAHLKITDSVFELFSYWAILSSIWLAKEKGSYESYEGSTWSKGILPIDSARPLPSEWLSECAVDWDAVKTALRIHGMRNSNCMAIAPTATISLIVGTTPCIEPTFRRVFVEENKSGKFKVIDPSLRHGRPELCKEVFEIDQEWIIKAAAVRQRYIDQSQSVNLYKSFGTKGSVISGWYFLAWQLGLKSTYYLRQETTEQADKRGTPDAIMCSMDSPEDCESCQ